ncbi:SDR family NAD(P)-dependent oxidoreductase [Neptunicella sp.]|uniref:SDR family NAD(P)-dependent oxidoreductase n=1 Tax=Neptunicella sp. TaxID=2125986 RepID=UPI003F68DB63
MNIRFEGKVAIVTGAGNGLGRSHALALAARGAKVVVNDLGGSVSGEGGDLSAAEQVVKEIKAAGGEAISNGANVTSIEEVNQMVSDTLAQWGRIDILVNNAGILRDKSFANMSLDDFKLVVDVHLMGAANCSKAVWPTMREQQQGTIIMTTSSSGLYGNFGQSNYGAAKMGVVGLMNVLDIEGKKYGIKVNAISPCAATRMMDGLIDQQASEVLTVESVSAGLVYLASDESPSRLILCAGAGGYAATQIFETDGIYLPPEQQTAENVAIHIDQIVDVSKQKMFIRGDEQTTKFVEKALASQQAE